MAKSERRWHQWATCCYRDKLRTKHFRVRRYFTREWYISGMWSCGWDIGFGFREFALLWGSANKIVWGQICEERENNAST